MQCHVRQKRAEVFLVGRASTKGGEALTAGDYLQQP